MGNLGIIGFSEGNSSENNISGFMILEIKFVFNLFREFFVKILTSYLKIL